MANWLAFTRVHCAVYRATGGLVGGNLLGIQMLLLTTRGRKTGQSRTLPLAYVEIEDEFVVVASNGGAEKPPAWWLNLQAQPIAEVQVRGERYEVSWEPVPQAKRMAYWRALQAAIPAYRMYRTRTDREIPLIRLQPLAAARIDAAAGWQTRAMAVDGVAPPLVSPAARAEES